jgi:uncharacterized membrane protein
MKSFINKRCEEAALAFWLWCGLWIIYISNDVKEFIIIFLLSSITILILGYIYTFVKFLYNKMREQNGERKSI